MRYALKQLDELTTAHLGAVMMPRAAARIIRRQARGFTRDNIAKLAQYRKAAGQTRPNVDTLELIATRIETGKLVLIRIPAPLVSSVVSPSGNVNHLLPRRLANKVHALAELTLVEDIENHIRNENSVNQSGGYTSAPAVVAATTASTAPAASRSMANAAAAPTTAQIKESITLTYDYVDGQPIEDIPYIVNHAGDIYEGVLSGGRALISDVDPGSYSVEYKAVDENEIVTLRNELKTNLDGMIAEVKAKAKIQEALIKKESYVMQGLIYSGAFFTGLYESGSSIASGLVEAVESGAELIFDAGAACWRLLKLLAAGDLAGLRSEFQEMAKLGGETFDTIKGCFKTLYIIAMDGESRTMLSGFPESYFDAHSSVEKKRLVGKLAFEIIFAIATFGAGAAVSAIAKSKYFVKAAQAVQDITKYIKLEKLNHKRDGTTNDDVLDEAERIDDELVPPVAIYQAEAKTVSELIDSDLDLSNSLNGKQGGEFKNDAIMDYHINPYTASLTQDEYLSLHVYTTNLFSPINNGLRGLSPEDKIKWAKVSSDTDAALIKLIESQDLVHNGQVIRGDNFDDDLLEQLFPVGGIHQDSGFKSSSYNLEKPFPGNTISVIKSKTGVKIDSVSVKPLEEEVLFRQNTKFKVIGKTKTNGINHILLEEL